MELLKIKQNNLDHFLITKKSQTQWSFRKNKEVIFFINTNELLKIKKDLQQELNRIIDIKIQSLFYCKSENKNIISFNCKEELELETYKSIKNYIKYFLLKKYDMEIQFELIDFAIIFKNKKEFDPEEIKEIVRNILFTKEEIFLKLYPKSIRKKINNILLKYKTIKYRTIGSFGNKRIKITSKLD